MVVQNVEFVCESTNGGTKLRFVCEYRYSGNFKSHNSTTSKRSNMMVLPDLFMIDHLAV